MSYLDFMRVINLDKEPPGSDSGDRTIDRIQKPETIRTQIQAGIIRDAGILNAGCWIQLYSQESLLLRYLSVNSNRLKIINSSQYTERKFTCTGLRNPLIFPRYYFAGVVELADALGSGPSELRLVRVRVPPPAP